VTVAPADLTTAFPEFGNAQVFPAAQIQFWCNIANDMLTVDVFGNRLSLAQLLYVAHNLVLSAQNVAAASRGGVAFGAVSGPVTSSSVGSVSKSIDVTLNAYQGAGPWNATSYGQRYFQMIKAFATGPYYVTKGMPSFVGPYPWAV
jgi:hypothetical protein